MFVWDRYDRFRISPAVTSQIRHRDVLDLLEELRKKNPPGMRIRELGTSYEGRSISIVTLGNGPTRVLAWSQMHGNEPTHTAALLDLISYLQTEPDEPVANSILSNCSLHLIVMLNPDGAQRFTRRNAQGIDINRDALHLQSPEGQLLRKTVEEIQPDFALNLHNQSPRRSVGSNPLRPAAVSLLVPPIDAENTQTDGTQRAKQLATSFLRAVEPRCSGMFSRYDADFMPRCFGEWVQQQGISTLTIEAGGWTTPSTEDSPLVKIHLLGLTVLLADVARGTYLDADPQVYDALPRSNEHDLFDVLLKGVTLTGNESLGSYSCDIGIDIEQIPGPPTAHIEDLGDLSVTTGKHVIDGSNSFCMPGRIAFLEDVSPGSLPDENRISALLRQGITSAIGVVDVAAQDEIARLKELQAHVPLPINVGFIADEEAVRRCEFPHSLQPLLFGRDLLNIPKDVDASPRSLESHVAELAQCIYLPVRASISVGSSADLLLLERNGNWTSEDPTNRSDLQRVIVAGNVVWESGQTLMNCVGRLLTSDLYSSNTY